MKYSVDKFFVQLLQFAQCNDFIIETPSKKDDDAEIKEVRIDFVNQKIEMQ